MTSLKEIIGWIVHFLAADIPFPFPSLRRKVSRVLLRTIDSVPLDILFGLFPPFLLMRRFRIDHLIRFTSELAVMLKRGIPLHSAVSAISYDSGRGRFWRILKELTDRLYHGERLSATLSDYPYYFNPELVRMIAAGERAERLPEALTLSSKRLRMQRHITILVRRELFYPFFLVLFSIFMYTMIWNYILPQYENIYTGFGAKLPALTKSIYQVFHYCIHSVVGYLIGFFLFPTILFLSSCGVFSIPILLLNLLFSFLLILAFLGGYIPILEMIWERIILCVPLLRKTWRLRTSSIFCGTLSFCMEGGVPWKEALQLAGESTGSVLLKRPLNRLAPVIERGDSLSQILEKLGTFPESFLWRIRLAERAEDLPQKLVILYRDGLEEYDSLLIQRTQWIRPVAVVTIGAIEAVLVIALYLPVFYLVHVIPWE